MSLVRLKDVTVRFEDTQSFGRRSSGSKPGTGRPDRQERLRQDHPPQTGPRAGCAGPGTVTLEPGTKLGYFSQFSDSTGTPDPGGARRLFAEVPPRGRARRHRRRDRSRSRDADLDRLIGRQAELFAEMDASAAGTSRGASTPPSRGSGSTRPTALPDRRAVRRLAQPGRARQDPPRGPDVLLLTSPPTSWTWPASNGSKLVPGLQWRRDHRLPRPRVPRRRRHPDHRGRELPPARIPRQLRRYVVQKQFRLKTLERSSCTSPSSGLRGRRHRDRREAAKAASRGLDKQLTKIKKSRAPRPVDQILTEIYGGLHAKDVLCRIEGLSKSYGEHLLFDDLTFEIRRATGSWSSAPTAAASPPSCGC